MNQISLIPGARPQHLATGVGVSDNAATGWSGGGFATLTIRGRVWRVRHRKEETTILASPGPGLAGVPVPQVPVIVVGIGNTVSKRFYLEGYSDGDGNLRPPDCYSADGVTPDPQSAKLQSTTCAACEWNRFGTARGTGRGKRCSDYKRIAVLLADEAWRNEYPEPLLLNVPPTSVQNLIDYTAMLKRVGGTDISQVRTSLMFDPDATHQVITFDAIGYVDDPKLYAEVVEHAKSDLVRRIVNTLEDVKEIADDEAKPAGLSGPRPAHLVIPPARSAPPAPPAPPPVVAAAPVVASTPPPPVPPVVAAAPPAPTPAPAPAPAQPVVQGAPADLEAEIDDLLSSSV